MQVEFTGRHIDFPAKLRATAQQYLDQLDEVVGEGSTAHVILSEEKFRKIAEVTIHCSHSGDLTAKCEDKEMEKALHDALVRVEKQALKLKGKNVNRRRHPEQNAIGSVRLQTSDEDVAQQPGVAARNRAGKAASAA